VADLFSGPQTGHWLIDGQRYHGAPASGDDLALSLMDLGLKQGLQATSLLKLSTTLSTQSSAGVVFDYYGPNDFKFVTVSAVSDQVMVGHRTKRGGWSVDAALNTTIRTGTDHELLVLLKGTTVSVSLDGQAVLGYVFNGLLVDGQFGLVTRDGGSSFDEVTLKTSDPAFLADGGGPGSSASDAELAALALIVARSSGSESERDDSEDQAAHAVVAMDLWRFEGPCPG
jgi:hypothetical protein